MNFTYIGYVKTDIEEKMVTNWGNIYSQLEITKELEKGLIGLKDFSHLTILYHLDKAEFSMDKHLCRKPQNREELPSVGIFAQRAKNRPNPIGITTVEFIDVKDNIIFVKGLDAINGTPILDIKPYYPQYDKVENAKIPDWVNVIMKKYF